MQKQEFEERIERTVTDEQYKVIEEVYMWHPSILKAKVAVQFDITFEGGIYQDRDIKPMDIGSVG